MRSTTRKLLRGGEGRTLLRGRRHLAGAGPTAHGADGLSAARHARLRHPRASEALEFSRLVRRVHPDTLSQIEVVNAARRPLLPYAALVLEHIVREAEPREVVFSALGVREGLLYSLLDAEERKKDALLAAAQELNLLRSRSPQHGEELIDWTDAFMATSGIDENAEEKRLRHAACLLADIGWRAHPDYRGEQSLNIIAHAAFVGIDHPGRAYHRARDLLPPRRPAARRGAVAAHPRTCLDPHARPRPRARRGAAGGLYGFGLAAGRAAAHAAQGRAASPGAAA